MKKLNSNLPISKSFLTLFFLILLPFLTHHLMAQDADINKAAKERQANEDKGRKLLAKEYPKGMKVLAERTTFGGPGSSMIANRMQDRSPELVTEARSKMEITNYSKVAGRGLWHIRFPFVNVTLVETPKGLVLLDSGYAAIGQVLVDLIPTLSEKPLLAIAISHSHVDHAYGAYALLERWPNAEVITTDAYPEEVSADIELRGSLAKYNNQALDNQTDNSSDPAQPTRTFHDKLDTIIGGEKFLFVVGGSATGCQLASILIDFGAEVDVIEFADRLTPPSDKDISRRLEEAFKKRGMNVLTGTGRDSIEKENGKLKVSFTKDEKKQSLETDAVFLMVGWPANVSGLNLAAAGVEMNGPYIKVNEYLQTNVPEIFVAGDANGVSMFVQSAAHQARVAAENAVEGAEKVYNPQAIATGSFTEPEYGSVGMTEDQALKEYDCLIETVDYTALPRAVMDGRTDGFCKLIVDRKTKLLLGAHVLGSYSAEVIQVAATCIVAKMNIHDIAELELAFPTFTEAIGMAAQRISKKLRLEN